MRHESRCLELLDHSPNRIAVRTQAALFMHHVTLFIELAEDGMAESLRLQIRPKLQPVHWERIKVLRAVHGGAGIQADPAVTLNEFAETVLDYILIGIFHVFVERGFQSGNL